MQVIYLIILQNLQIYGCLLCFCTTDKCILSVIFYIFVMCQIAVEPRQKQVYACLGANITGILRQSESNAQGQKQIPPAEMLRRGYRVWFGYAQRPSGYLPSAAMAFSAATTTGLSAA